MRARGARGKARQSGLDNGTSTPVVVWWIAPSLRADSPVCVVGGITTLPGTVGFGDAAISASVGLPVETMETGACVGCTRVV